MLFLHPFDYLYCSQSISFSYQSIHITTKMVVLLASFRMGHRYFLSFHKYHIPVAKVDMEMEEGRDKEDIRKREEVIRGLEY